MNAMVKRKIVKALLFFSISSGLKHNFGFMHFQTFEKRVKESLTNASNALLQEILQEIFFSLFSIIVSMLSSFLTTELL